MSRKISKHSNHKKVLAAVVLLLSIVGGSYVFAENSDTANQQQNIKNQSENVKNYRREVTDIQRIDNKIDVTSLTTIINKYEACLGTLQSLVGTPDFWNSQNECNQYSRDAEDVLNTVFRPARTCAEIKRNVENRRRERKSNVGSQLKDILRNDKTADLSQLNALAAQIDANIARADALLVGTCNGDISAELQDINRDNDTAFQDFYSASNELNQKANDSRRFNEGTKEFEKNIKRQCEKDMGRELKNFEKDIGRATKKVQGIDLQTVQGSVRGLYDTLCVDLVGRMQNSLQSGDIDGFEEAKNEFYNGNREFWDTLNETRGTFQEVEHKIEQVKNISQDLKNKERRLKDMNRQITKIKKQYTRTAKRFTDTSNRKEALERFAGLVGEAEELAKLMATGIANAKEQAPQDPDSYWDENSDTLEEIQEKFEELGQTLQMLGNIMPGLVQGEKGVAEARKELDRLVKDGLSEEEQAPLRELVERATEALRNAWATVITSPEDAINAMEELKDIGEQWDSLMQLEQ